MEIIPIELKKELVATNQKGEFETFRKGKPSYCAIKKVGEKTLYASAIFHKRTIYYAFVVKENGKFRSLKNNPLTKSEMRIIEIFISADNLY